MVLLIFMKFEKINIPDDFLRREMLWFQAPEKTTGEFCKAAFFSLSVGRELQLGRVTASLTRLDCPEQTAGGRMEAEAESADMHV